MNCPCTACRQRGTPCRDHEKRVAADRYHLEIVSIGESPVPEIVRLRRLLKSLGRALGFRVVKVARVKEGER